jgi:hypothetical protein
VLGDRSDTSGGALPLWHVTLTVSGAPWDPEALRVALDRLVEERPFMLSVRYDRTRAELRYWDEAEDVDDAAALGLRLWAEHRRQADLPDWRAVAVEVVDRDTLHARGQRLPAPTTMGEVRPW